MEIILSLDPGLEDTGWAVLEVGERKLILKDFGVIKTSSTNTVGERLKFIYDEVSNKILKYSVTQGAIEGMFFIGKIKTQALSLYAKGIILLAFENAGIKCWEINPVSVKKSVCGDGKASKEGLERVVKMMFGIKEKLYPDVSDAIAIGITASRIISYNKAVR